MTSHCWGGDYGDQDHVRNEPNEEVTARRAAMLMSPTGVYEQQNALRAESFSSPWFGAPKACLPKGLLRRRSVSFTDDGMIVWHASANETWHCNERLRMWDTRYAYVMNSCIVGCGIQIPDRVVYDSVKPRRLVTATAVHMVLSDGEIQDHNLTLAGYRPNTIKIQECCFRYTKRVFGRSNQFKPLFIVLKRNSGISITYIYRERERCTCV